MQAQNSTQSQSLATAVRQRKPRVTVTLADVARRAGVSTCTVSRVLSGAPEGVPIRPPTRLRVEQAARELGYVPNAAARALAAGHTKTIGVVCYSISDPIVPPLLETIENEAEKLGYQLLISTTKNDPQQETIQGDAYIALLQEKRVDAILVFGERIIESKGYLADYPEITSAIGVGITGEGLACSVDIDHYAGGVTVGEYLASLGHRQVAFLTGGLTNESTQRRHDGIREGLRQSNADLICIGENLPMPYDQAGRGNIITLLEKYPNVTAAICRNDMMALGAMRGLYELGIRIPDQFSLVSWGDAYFAPLTCPALTAIKSPFQEAGRELLLQLIQSLRKPAPTPSHAIVPMELMIRESSGVVRGCCG